jgi:hypothetical protein
VKVEFYFDITPATVWFSRAPVASCFPEYLLTVCSGYVSLLFCLKIFKMVMVSWLLSRHYRFCCLCNDIVITIVVVVVVSSILMYPGAHCDHNCCHINYIWLQYQTLSNCVLRVKDDVRIVFPTFVEFVLNFLTKDSKKMIFF